MPIWGAGTGGRSARASNRSGPSLLLGPARSTVSSRPGGPWPRHIRRPGRVSVVGWLNPLSRTDTCPTVASAARYFPLRCLKNRAVAQFPGNAALSKAGQVRIVVPTVYRNNYLAGLSGGSNGNGSGETLIAVLNFAQRWTAAVDWSDYHQANAILGSVHAYMDAGLADNKGIKLKLPA